MFLRCHLHTINDMYAIIIWLGYSLYLKVPLNMVQSYTGCPRKIDTVKLDYSTIEGEISTKYFFMELKTDY